MVNYHEGIQMMHKIHIVMFRSNKSLGAFIGRADRTRFFFSQFAVDPLTKSPLASRKTNISSNITSIISVQKKFPLFRWIFAKHRFYIKSRCKKMQITILIEPVLQYIQNTSLSCFTICPEFFFSELILLFIYFLNDSCSFAYVSIFQLFLKIYFHFYSLILKSCLLNSYKMVTIE